MHFIFLPILGDALMNTASSGAVFIVLLTLAAIVRGR